MASSRGEEKKLWCRRTEAAEIRVHQSFFAICEKTLCLLFQSKPAAAINKNQDRTNDAAYLEKTSCLCSKTVPRLQIWRKFTDRQTSETFFGLEGRSKGALPRKARTLSRDSLDQICGSPSGKRGHCVASRTALNSGTCPACRGRQPARRCTRPV